MSRYSNMPPAKKRALLVGTIAFFVIMVGMIAWAYIVAEGRVH